MERELRDKYPNIRSVEDVPTIGAFIVFNKAEDMIHCLKVHKQRRLIVPKEMKLKEMYLPKVEQADEPNNILWENLEISFLESLMRSLFVVFLVILLLITSFFVVYGLRVYQNKLPTTDDCDQYLDYTLETVDKSDKDALDCVCRQEGLWSIIFDSSLQDDCGDYMNTTIYRFLVNIAVGVCVSIINYIIKLVFNYLSQFERYKTVTGLNDAIMKKSFIATFINLAILYLLINANFQSSGFIKGIADGIPGGGSELFFNGDYSDLNRDWYSKVAVSIIVLVLSSLVSTVISTLIFEVIG